MIRSENVIRKCSRLSVVKLEPTRVLFFKYPSFGSMFIRPVYSKFNFFCPFLFVLFYLDADSENESVKESPQITSVTVEQTEEHVFAK